MAGVHEIGNQVIPGPEIRDPSVDQYDRRTVAFDDDVELATGNRDQSSGCRHRVILPASIRTHAFAR